MSENKSSQNALIIFDRLRAVAKKMGGDMNQAMQFVQTRYVYERLLARLQMTNFADRWALKGGVQMLALPSAVHRMTLDIDWSQTDGEPLSVSACLREICGLETNPDDAMAFSLIEDGKDALRVTRETAEQPTIRGKLIATLCLPRPNERRFIVDITPAELSFQPQKLTWLPTIRGFEAFQVSAYPWELVLAEKLHSVLTATEQTPRLRDYMDVIALGQAEVFDHESTVEWLRRVFERRGSISDLDMDGPGLTDGFAKRRQTDWIGTLNRTGYSGHMPNSFSDAIEQVRSIALPLVEDAKMSQCRHLP